MVWLCGNFIAGDDLFLFLLIFMEEMQWVDGSNGTENIWGKVKSVLVLERKNYRKTMQNLWIPQIK